MRVLAVLVTLVVVSGACGDDGDASSGWIDVETDGYVYSVESLGDGFIASEDADGATRFIVSDDGLTWETVDTDVVAPGESMYWMDGGPDGAVGEVFEEGLPQVITTADGSTFVRADPLGDLGFAEVGIHGMAWGPTGPMVAISRGTEPIGLVASTDGATWASIDLPDGIIDFVTVGSPLAATESGYMFVGIPDDEGGIAGSASNPGIQAWSSTDGATWVPEEISPGFVAGISSPVPWRHGYAASGSTFAPDDESGDEGTWESLMWRSTGDGVWSMFEAAGYEGLNEVILVDGSDLGVFAVAWANDTRLDALFSEDLETWQVWSDDEAFGTSNALVIDWGAAAVGSSAVVVPVDGDLRVYEPDGA